MPSGPLFYEPRPEREGIKTHLQGVVSGDAAMNRDLKEKGLRRQRPYQTLTVWPYEPRPEREGIKTQEDDYTLANPSMNRDLKEKGLRPGGAW